MQNSDVLLVSDATSSLGVEVIRSVIRDTGRTVLAGAADPDKAAALLAQIPGHRLKVLPLDVSSSASVRAFARLVRRELGDSRLIAGMACNGAVRHDSAGLRSADGHELTFAANYLGHFLLIHELLPLLARKAAVITLTDATHNLIDLLLPRDRFARVDISAASLANGSVRLDDATATPGEVAYAASRLCNVLFTYEMARRIPAQEARFIAYDPCLLQMAPPARAVSIASRQGWQFLEPFMNRRVEEPGSLARSGSALAVLLADPLLVRATGIHVDVSLRTRSTSAASYRPCWQRELYASSIALCGLEEAGLDMTPVFALSAA